MSRVIDFSTGQFWGHAMHGHTWREATTKGMSLLDRLRYWWDFTRRGERACSFLCHTQKRPVVGGIVRYRAECGIVEREIVGVIPFRDPPDMYEIVIRSRTPTGGTEE